MTSEKQKEEIQRIVTFLSKQFPTPEAHDELKWIAEQSLPVSLIERGSISLKVWYHHVRRTLSDVENNWGNL